MVSEVWTFIIIIILIVFVVMKVTSKKQEIVIKLVLLIFVFLMLTTAYVYIKTDSEINGVKDIFYFGKVYFTWLGSIFGNFKILTTDAVDLDWNADNETLDEKSIFDR